MSTVPIRSADTAVDLIPAGARIVSTASMGEPTTLLRALDRAAGGRGWTLSSGLLFGECPFHGSVGTGALRYRTWQVTKPVRGLVADGLAAYLPVRASALAGLLSSEGVDVAMVRVGPPDASGRCSFGASTSYAAHIVGLAALSIAEIDPSVPRTRGDSLVPLERFAAVVDSTEPIPTYRPSLRTETTDRITDHVLSLIPHDPTLQIGVGAVPESLVRALTGSGLGAMRFVGMVTDDMLDLADAGLLRTGHAGDGEPALLSPELHGSERLLSWSADNPLLEMHPSSVAHDTCRLGAIDRFISVNSAIEVDVFGAVNSESAAGRQVSGTGGSIDYIETAAKSTGGMSIIALSASGPGGQSRVVPRVEVTSLPRAMVDTVVTEHGIARLKGRSIPERAEAMIAIAPPEHRDALQTHLDERFRLPATG